MYQQKVQNKPLKTLQGIGIVVGALAAAAAGSLVFNLLTPYIGSAASIGFIIYGCLIAWALMNRFVLSFVYYCDGNSLKVFRCYGKRERFMCEVWLNNTQGYGDPGKVRAKLPGSRNDRAVRPRCELAPFAIAYRDGKRQAILTLQPDDKLREILLKTLKKK